MPVELENIILGLSENKINLLHEISIALNANIKATINNRSDICTDLFAEEFQNRLILYHAMNEEPLKKKTFEFAFSKACHAAGWDVSLENNPTNPGTDATVNDVDYSLKTEAAKSINREKITISKLMEARWIRECRSGKDFLNGIKKQVVPHLNQYERILILRAFVLSDILFEYHLIEIPKDLLLKVKMLNANDFSERTKNGSSKADISIRNERAFSIRLDGSVEKVTITGLLQKLCIFHGGWEVPVYRKS